METIDRTNHLRPGGDSWALAWDSLDAVELVGDGPAAEETLAVLRRVRYELSSVVSVAVADILTRLGRPVEALAELQDVHSEWVDHAAGPLPLRQPRLRPAVTLVCENECWTLRCGEEVVRLQAARGLSQLALLIANPGVEIHALDLFASTPALGLGTGAHPDHRGQPVLDGQAKRAYRHRLEALDEEATLATALGDDKRAIRVDDERAALIDELRRARGLGGRDRRLGSDAERARVNVTRTLRAALERIERLAPEAGSHLRVSVRTGTFCCYQPGR